MNVATQVLAEKLKRIEEQIKQSEQLLKKESHLYLALKKKQTSLKSAILAIETKQPASV